MPGFVEPLLAYCQRSLQTTGRELSLGGHGCDICSAHYSTHSSAWSQLGQKPVRCVVAGIASTPDAAIQVQVVGVVCTKLHIVWQWLQDRVGRVPAVHECLHPYSTGRVQKRQIGIHTVTCRQDVRQSPASRVSGKLTASNVTLPMPGCIHETKPWS